MEDVKPVIENASELQAWLAVVTSSVQAKFTINLAISNADATVAAMRERVKGGGGRTVAVFKG